MIHRSDDLLDVYKDVVLVLMFQGLGDDVLFDLTTDRSQWHRTVVLRLRLATLLEYGCHQCFLPIFGESSCIQGLLYDVRKHRGYLLCTGLKKNPAGMLSAPDAFRGFSWLSSWDVICS